MLSGTFHIQEALSYLLYMTNTSPGCKQVPRHVNYNRLYMLCAHTWHVDEVLPELEKLKLADIKPYVQAVLKK